MSHIKDSIRNAEAATPHVEYSSQVVRPASTPSDHNAENLRTIWRILSPERRKKLEQDYKLWQSTVEHIDSIKAIVAQFPTESPLKRRLKFAVKPPSAWSVCGTCQGSGDGDIGYCRMCSGDGYTI